MCCIYGCCCLKAAQMFGKVGIRLAHGLKVTAGSRKQISFSYHCHICGLSFCEWRKNNVYISGSSPALRSVPLVFGTRIRISEALHGHKEPPRQN